jgi:adenylate cyclase
MEKQNSTHNLFRYGGAVGLLLLSLVLIVLSFLGREGTSFSEERKHSLLGRLIYSASFVENWFYDLRTTRFYVHDKKSPNLVIAEINDETLNTIGRWPWPRTKHAKILDNLRAYGAKVVVFDVVFPEPESPEADQAFVDAINRFTAVPHNSVLMSYAVTDDPAKSIRPLPDVLLTSAISGISSKEPMPREWWPDRFAFVAPKLQESQAAFAFISAVPDLDGVFRSYQLVQEMDQTYIPSLGFRAFADFYANGADQSVSLEPTPGPAYRLRILSKAGERDVLLNAQGELKVRFYGGDQSFVRVPLEKVIKDEHPETNEELKRTFAGKAVLIGSSAFAANDLRHTPVDPLTPGMYMHANLFHALDQNLLFQRDDAGLAYSLVLFALGAGVVLGLSLLKNPLIETLGTLAILAALFAADYFFIAPKGYFVRLFFVMNGSLWVYAWFTLLSVFSEAQEKKKIRDAFSRYVAPEIVKEMLSNPDKLKVGGEKREITMLFSDVRDFTTISERLSATDLAALLNVYMGRMTDILFETGGTLDKYIGDAMVGFWGAPLDLADHAYHAVRGAKQMLEALPAINAEFERRKFPRINVGIGLNTGEVSVGNMGSDKIFQYTALGDHMNLASRLESLTKYYGVNLMISEFTYEKLGAKRAEFRLRPLDLVQVKGKSKAVKIYEVIPDWNPWAKEGKLLEQYCRAYEELYLQRKFQEAIEIFQSILELLPEDKNTLKLLHNAEEYLKQPPPDGWDGVTVFTTK